MLLGVAPNSFCAGAAKVANMLMVAHRANIAIGGRKSLFTVVRISNFLFGRFRLFSGFWGHVEATAVEVDGVNEVLFVPEASRRVFHPLNLGIDGFASRVRDPVPQVRDDVFEPPLQHPRHLDHRLQPAPHCPVVPPAEVLPRRTFVDATV